MKLVRQPKDSDLCGQACVATITGITLEESIMIFRSDRRTITKQLKQALRQMGRGTAERLKRGEPDSGLHIVKFVYDGGKVYQAFSHWVVWKNGKLYDPAAGVFRTRPKYLKDARITSHLEIYDSLDPPTEED